MEEQKYLKRKRKAENDGNKTVLTAACIDLAEYYFQEGRYEVAIAEYKMVSDLYFQQNQAMDYARANRMIGEAYNHLREFNKALQHQEIHLAVAREQGDKLEEQRALATVGHTYLTSYLDIVDNPDKKGLKLATKAFMKSMAVCEGLTGISKLEHKDIMARLYANLGVVKECEGNYEKGIELVMKSINICKANDIYEQLERCYTLLGSLYYRNQNYSSAIHHYNLAMEVAGRLKDKTYLICASLLSKSEILLKLSDFHNAKNVLLKAYKLKTPNKTDKDNIEHNLKVVAAMCYTEDTLLTTRDTDYATKKKLYEKMGDGACDLKIYSNANEYYKKMLECAENNGDSGKDLSICYVSLAQTYKDNEDFDLAIEYFQKDYDICKGNLKECISTLISIAEAMELAGKGCDAVVKVLKQSLSECRSAGDRHFQGKTLNRLIGVYKKYNRVADIPALELQLADLDYSSDNESEELTGEQNTPNVGDDVDLNNITDVSDVSDSESSASKPRAARTRRGFVIKKNNKGETQLHTACIAGNSILVKKLLEQGHTVNIRDNCGWLPIHEACICGHLEIVRMLVEKGASINDRGGTLCNGMTPLHDAASNGHLEIIEYILDNGASAVSKTDNGETPLHILENWRKTVDLDPIEQTFYETLVKRLLKALEKAGHNKDDVMGNKENMALVPSQSNPLSQRRSRSNNSTIGNITSCSSQKKRSPNNGKKRIGDMRRNLEYDDDVDENVLVLEGSDSSVDATDEYKTIMETLRTKTGSNLEVNKKRKNDSVFKRSALLEPNEVGEDWLDDDIGVTKMSKKRKVADVFSIDSRVNISASYREDNDISSSGTSSHKRKTQSSLINAGFTRNRSISPTVFENKRRSDSPQLNISQNKRKTQSKLTNFTSTQQSVVEPDSTTLDAPKPTVNTIVNTMLSIDVRIDGKLFRIPVPMSDIGFLTMKWLADEAINRFYKKEAMKPTIELETKNGAMLSEDDFVSILFPASGLQSEEVQGKVIKWNIPPLVERYKDACVALNKNVNDKVLELLDSSTITLSLLNKNLRASLLPVCRALSRQTNLYELNLTGNLMGDKCVELLCEAFPTLDNLTILNLSLNNLGPQSLNYIATAITNSNNPIISNLTELDLSYNPLTNECFKHLATITTALRLKTLNLCSIEFNNNLFQVYYNKKLRLQLDYIENFDISYNELSRDDLAKFLQWLQPKNLVQLNLGCNEIESEGLGLDVANFFKATENGVCSLTSLNLSRCMICDKEISEILSVLENTGNLEDLDLSFNNITSTSFKQLLENCAFTKLNVSSCEDLCKNFDNCLQPWMLNYTGAIKKCEVLCTTLDYVENFNECDTLINMWREEYKERAGVTGLDSGMMQLYVIS